MGQAQEKYFRLHCPLCSGQMEYVVRATGTRAACPHCGGTITLSTGRASRVPKGAPTRSAGARLTSLSRSGFVGFIAGELKGYASSLTQAALTNDFSCSACQREVSRKDRFCPGCGALFA